MQKKSKRHDQTLSNDESVRVFPMKGTHPSNGKCQETKHGPFAGRKRRVFPVREMHKLADVILVVTWTVARSLWALVWQVTIKARLSATTRSVHTHRASYRKRETVRFLSSSFHPRVGPLRTLNPSRLTLRSSTSLPLSLSLSLSLSLTSARPALQFTVYVDGLMLPAACTARLASLRYQPSTPTQPPTIVLTPVLWFSPPASVFLRRRPWSTATRGRPIGQRNPGNAVGSLL